MRPRLFGQVVSLEARTRMSYRADFWLTAFVGFIADFGVVYFTWMAMFAESGRAFIGNRDEHGMLLYVLAVVVFGKMVRGNRFHGTVSSDIYEGHLNRYLMFPSSYFAFKYAQRLGYLVPTFLQMVFMGTVSVVVLDLGLVTTPAAVLMALAALMLGNLLYFLCECAIQQVAFWADNVWSLDVAFWFVASLLGGWMVPLSIYPDWARATAEVLPFRFFFDFPARVLLGEIGVAEWASGLALGAGWCLVVGAIGRLVWRRGQLQYAGVGI